MNVSPARAALFAAILAAVAACGDPDRPFVPEPGAGVAVFSDPPGAEIRVNGQATGRVTPDTLRELPVGTHQIGVRLEIDGIAYGLNSTVAVDDAEMAELLLPLLAFCPAGNRACLRGITGYEAAGRLVFAHQPTTMLLFRDGDGQGLFWPAGTNNEYASTGTPVFAGIADHVGDTVALGPYSHEYLSARPAPWIEWQGDAMRLGQSAWILPPPSRLPMHTVRGIEIRQEVRVWPDHADVLLVRMVFRNITNLPSYRSVDLLLPGGGITYRSAYIGFALDGDVGDSNDDLLSYVPDLNMAFIYDSDFREPGFGSGWSDRPGLIGLRALEWPEGTDVVMNGWVRDLPGNVPGDWFSGEVGEGLGWRVLSATHTNLPNHADPRIGFVPPSPVDVRVGVAAGPFDLAPGDSAVLTIAVIMAAPAAGTYTSGTVVPSGDPFDTSRQIYQVAQPLRHAAIAAESLLDRLDPP